jgi:hypothetical protein
MTDSIYADALERIERRLSKPRDLALHSIFFSAVTIIAVISNLTTYNFVDGKTYWGVYFWCLALAAHGFFHYRRSGLSKNAREEAIQTELLSLAAEYDLSIEELIDLHARLADDVARRAVPLRWTLGTIVGYQALWQGLLWSGLLVSTFFDYVTPGYMTPLQITAYGGTMILGFVQIVVMFLSRRTASEDDELRNAYLRALYNTKLEKSKRQATQRMAVDDEGEIVLHESVGQRKLR